MLSRQNLPSSHIIIILIVISEIIVAIVVGVMIMC